MLVPESSIAMREDCSCVGLGTRRPLDAEDPASGNTILRVGPARTSEPMWPCSNCEPSAEHEGVVSLIRWVEARGCTGVETVSS